MWCPHHKTEEPKQTKAFQVIPILCVSQHHPSLLLTETTLCLFSSFMHFLCHKAYLYTEMTWILLTWIAYNYRYCILLCVGDTFLTTFVHLFYIFNTKLTLTFGEVDFFKIILIWYFSSSLRIPYNVFDHIHTLPLLSLTFPRSNPCLPSHSQFHIYFSVCF